MNNLIKIEIRDNQQLVSGRELHKFLEVGTRYNDWINRIIEKYNFIENKDFITITQKRVTAQGNETEFDDHLMTIAMAKEIAMVSNTEKGKEARIYFIKCEEAWNSPEMILARANQIQSRMIENYADKIKILENKIEEDKPKVEFYNDVTDSKNTCDMQTVAKTLNFKGVGRNNLFEILRKENILQSDNKPYQRYVDSGWFRLIETKYNDYKTSEVKISYKTVVFQKGIEKISALLKDLGYTKVAG
ncbi:phage antirepressor KilAC domain-containing protein [Fusobacterium polymorphum]|uniref:phage antirepressor KilAC domain-containing protein n=1 Tax=Fusobacterium nucleatum subsp. polymorphum TaxID=76857 RepID=UPI00300B0612